LDHKEDLMSEKIPWPQKGDRAFVSADEGKSLRLNHYPAPYPLKPQAFKIAAEMVIGQCREDDPFRYRDEMFFPVAFLYRHGLELLMKDIIYTGIHMNFFKRHDVEKVLADHNLAKLWSQAKKLLIDRWPGAHQTPLKATEAVINECNQADPNGQVFRYDEDKNGRPYRHETLPKSISLDEMRKTMDGVFAFLDTTASCLRDDLSNMMDAARGCL
jgi:hypothetical protein